MASTASATIKNIASNNIDRYPGNPRPACNLLDRHLPLLLLKAETFMSSHICVRPADPHPRAFATWSKRSISPRQGQLEMQTLVVFIPDSAWLRTSRRLAHNGKAEEVFRSAKTGIRCDTVGGFLSIATSPWGFSSGQFGGIMGHASPLPPAENHLRRNALRRHTGSSDILL